MDPRWSHANLEDMPSPMALAVEATRFARERRGIGRYVRALLPRLLAQRPGLRIILFVKRARDIAVVEAMLAAHPGTRQRIEARPVSELTRCGADVFWYPWNVADPLPAHGPVVVTVHDVAPLALPDPRLLKWRKNLRWRMRYGAVARRATLIVTDSSFTADEVHHYLHVPYDKMRVVLLAADDFIAPAAGRDAEVLERHGVRKPYLLAVGAADPRKNLALLERAMPRVVAANPAVTLVLAGPRDERAAEEAAWKRTLGFVSEEDLAVLYRSAEALVVPSFYEGFGLPPLEAMQLGTPVVCARASSLPEVGGDAVAWVEPHDDRHLAAVLIRLLGDPLVSASMRQAGLVQASLFSWDETARRTLSVFEEALQLSGLPR